MIRILNWQRIGGVQVARNRVILLDEASYFGPVGLSFNLYTFETHFFPITSNWKTVSNSKNTRSTLILQSIFEINQLSKRPEIEFVYNIEFFPVQNDRWSFQSVGFPVF